MFLQIHTLTSYPASLLNRDDAGLAKRIPFGNALRLRVSSQCLKRHWREDLSHRLSHIPDGQRTRSFFTRTVLPRAVEAGVPQAVANQLIEPLAKAVIDGGVKEGGDLNQPVLFGLREADYFVQLLKDASSQPDPGKALTERLKTKDEKDNIKAMSKAAAGLTAALFGRMVTSDLLARVDAPVHVAHAFTVHAANTEMDYFTVVDDLNRDDETGAAHANQTELGAGLYYGYVAVDVPLLVGNLTGADPKDWRNQDPATVRQVLEALIDSVARQSPGAKKGSTAPYAWAEMVFLETGRSQPRTLANAFLDALRLDGKADPRQAAIDRLAAHLEQLDAMYGSSNGSDDEHGRFLSTTLEPTPPLPPKQPLRDSIRAALDRIFGRRG
ncbi:CRISPR system Cascade subunit CasC [Tepidimonas alkaliphilus]|uniref:CRISPR system Cascade subunit CasC n=1 Tax=Tepidimonas alkaliphilus TaxID=2588942 RepID=A0A554WAL1_9BURK|nr:type I-E CRISPR-associated protein Cas7/Cse4/CasC [Tepidimonas alkaliphilus]TSE20598.1 CRISPR system Cascade subunit CasC [Tepidimonas alkaliphilus]